MIEMQFICGTAENAFASITLPDLELNRGWYYSPSLRMKGCRNSKVFFSLDSLEPEFEYRPTGRSFSPRVNQMEHSVVRPYSGMDLFVYPYAFRLTLSSLVLDRGGFKMAVLR